MTGCNHTNPTSNGKTLSIRNLYGDVQYPYVKGMMSVFRRFLRGPRMLRMGMCLAGITAENSSPGRPRTPSSLPLPFGHRLPYSSASRCSRICGRMKMQMQFSWWSILGQLMPGDIEGLSIVLWDECQSGPCLLLDYSFLLDKLYTNFCHISTKQDFASSYSQLWGSYHPSKMFQDGPDVLSIPFSSFSGC